MTDKKELRSLYNYYKNTEKGFVTRMAPSTGKKLGIVYEGEILKFCRNEDSANNFIASIERRSRNWHNVMPNHKFNANIII